VLKMDRFLKEMKKTLVEQVIIYVALEDTNKELKKIVEEAEKKVLKENKFVVADTWEDLGGIKAGDRITKPFNTCLMEESEFDRFLKLRYPLIKDYAESYDKVVNYEVEKEMHKTEKIIIRLAYNIANVEVNAGVTNEEVEGIINNLELRKKAIELNKKLVFGKELPA
jgi:hypothetical protein